MINSVFIDEYHRIGDVGRLDERVRAVPGVPPYRYVSKGDLVFVFAKLVSLVMDVTNLVEGNGPLDKATLMALVEQAHVSPIEAVRDWGVVPTPYAIDGELGSLQIRHVPFHATLPEIFPDMQSAQIALAVLLSGGIVSKGRPGDFAYRGQPLKRLPALTITLPPKPSFGWSHSKDSRSKLDMLRDASDIAGFQPLRTDKAEEYLGAQDLWDLERARLVSSSVARLPDMWRALEEKEDLRPGSFALEFHASRSDVPEDDVEALAELRDLYPEMRLLSDATLLDEFESWDLVCNTRPQGPRRVDTFPLHALGSLASRNTRGVRSDEATLHGAALVRSWLRLEPGSIDAANKLANEARHYDKTLREMTFRQAGIHAFLQEDAQTPCGQGPAVRTPGDFVSDTMREGRKYSIAVQKLADFRG